MQERGGCSQSSGRVWGPSVSGEPRSSQHYLSFAGSWEEVLPGEKLAKSSGRSFCSDTVLKAPGQRKLACLLFSVCAGGTSAGRFRGFKGGLRLCVVSYVLMPVLCPALGT